METNVIYCGDCLVKLKEIPDGSIDLIYIDPPFSSNRNYVAFWQEQEKRHFEDRFENVTAYLDYMKPRLIELYRVLKPTGSFYYHCDWHASHYIKMLLDSSYLFGYSNFRNEIIWQRTGAHNDPKQWGRVADTILFYSKSNTWAWNPQFATYSGEYIKERYKYVDEMTGRLYWRNTMTAAGAGQPKSFRGKQLPPPSGTHWRFSQEEIDRLESEGRIYYSPSGKPYIKSFLDEQRGRQIQSIWTDIVISKSGKERLGYPTQKPLALLDRIVKASSSEGDIVLDAFCGCGTTIISSQLLKRKWIGIDISPTACRVMAKRLEDTTGITEGRDFVIKDLPKTVEELRIYPAFEFQNWVINALGGVPNKVKVRDKGIDGKLYPIEDIKKEKKEGMDLFGDIDRYVPIQVKRTDQIGRPDIENFEVAMKRDKREKGIFIGFDFSRDALKEIRRVEREEGLFIEPKTVNQIVEDQLDKSLL